MLLRAVATGTRSVAMEHLREILDAHAWVEDVNIFSGVMISYRLQLRGANIAEFAIHLRRADVLLDAESETVLASWVAAHPEGAPDTPAMLNASFPEGDADMRHEIPRVPG